MLRPPCACLAHSRCASGFTGSAIRTNSEHSRVTSRINSQVGLRHPSTCSLTMPHPELLSSGSLTPVQTVEPNPLKPPKDKDWADPQGLCDLPSLPSYARHTSDAGLLEDADPALHFAAAPGAFDAPAPPDDICPYSPRYEPDDRESTALQWDTKLHIQFPRGGKARQGSIVSAKLPGRGRKSSIHSSRRSSAASVLEDEMATFHASQRPASAASRVSLETPMPTGLQMRNVTLLVATLPDIDQRIARYGQVVERWFTEAIEAMTTKVGRAFRSRDRPSVAFWCRAVLRNPHFFFVKDSPSGAHRALCVRCAKSRLFSTPGSHRQPRVPGS